MKSETAHTIPDFSIKDIPGTSGRLDVICRCLISSFGKGDEGRNTDFYAVLEGGSSASRLIVVEGRRLKHLPKDEFEAATIVRQLLGKNPESENVLNKWPGFSTYSKGFQETVNELKGQGVLFYLHQDGHDIRRFDFPKDGDLVFILGDHLGLTKTDEEFLHDLGVVQISVGPLIYLASHCIRLVQEELGWQLEDC